MKEMVTSIVVVVPPEVVVRFLVLHTVPVSASDSGSEEQAVRPRIAPKARSRRVVNRFICGLLLYIVCGHKDRAQQANARLTTLLTLDYKVIAYSGR
nr:MAG TPA: hypothetical protein [Caudoviricetes sp.]